MKIFCLQENLKRGLFAVTHVAGKNSNLPILNNVLIEVSEGNIKVVATNLEIGVSGLIRGKIEKNGTFTVDARIISDYVSLLPNKKINLEQKENNLLISCGGHKTKIRGQAADEFPLIPRVEGGVSCAVDTQEFKNALTQVVFAVATTETRLELSGVFFSFQEKTLTMAATDSYRLAEKKIELKAEWKEKDIKKIIVPAKTLQEVARVLAGPKDEAGTSKEKRAVEIHISENQILFVYGTTEIVSRLIEGQYPDYQQIVPASSKTQVLVSRAELTRAVKASSIFSKTGINDVNLDFPKNKKQIVVSAVSGQTGESSSEVEAEVKGEDNGVVVNYRYLLDGLNNIKEETIKIEAVDNNTPCVLKGEKETDYLYVIMPIKQ